jgi:hypothetical protein
MRARFIHPEPSQLIRLWASCHSFDYNEPWYEDTDEATFRPWEGPLPVDPSEGMFLVRAVLRAADGREFRGFLTPASTNAGYELGLIQPCLAAGGKFFGFWWGLQGVASSMKDAFYAELGSTPDRIFPMNFACSAALATGVCSGTIDGFYSSPTLGEYVVER